MMSLWDALRMNMMISYQELVRTFPSGVVLNCILFNYDGKVYGSDESRMLQKVNPEADFSAGEFASLSFSSNEYYRSALSSSFNFAMPGCDTCAYQPFCGADPCQNIESPRV